MARYRKGASTGGQYRGGRAKGRKNLKKLDSGNLQNQYGVIFSPEDKKRLESAVNTANRKRKKMLQNEGDLAFLQGGKDTGSKVKNLQAMGRESDFILAPKSKSMQKFRSREEYERYLSNLDRVNKPDYIDERVRQYKRNHIQAIRNVFGDEGRDIAMKIQMMKPADYKKLVASDEFGELSYVYDPSELHGKANRIRMALGMKLK